MAFTDPLGQQISLQAVEATPVMVETAPDGRRQLVLRAMGERRKRFTAPEGTTYHRDPSILEVWPEPGKTIVVERALKEGRVQRQSASGVLMRLVRPMGGGSALLGAADPTQRGVLVTLQLMNVSAEELDEAGELVVPDVEAAAASGAMSEWMLSELRLADAAPDQLLNLGSYPLLAEVQKRMETKVSDRATIGPAVDQLVKRIKDLMREAMSKEHERLAMAAACLVMILMGTVHGDAAARLAAADDLPVGVLPGAGDGDHDQRGQQLTHGHGAVGLLLLWGGVLALAVYAVARVRQVGQALRSREG